MASKQSFLSKESKKPLVSVVIPAYNVQNIIKKCINSIANQTFGKRNIEIIIIDDVSTDKTKNSAFLEGKKNNLNLKVFTLKKHEERGVARNIGSKKAKGKYLLFLDADMKLANRVVEECLEVLTSNPKFKAVIIPEEAYGEGFWSACRKLEKKCYIGNDQIEAARFIETEAFWKVGGWDPTMISGEDWDLTRRLRERYQIARVNSLIYHYEGHLTLLFTARKKYYYGTTLLPYWRNNLAKSSFAVSMIVRPAYFNKRKLLLSDPVHALGMVILKAVEFSAMGAGLLRSRLFRAPSNF